MEKRECILLLDAIAWTLFGMAIAYFHMGVMNNVKILVVLIILALIANVGVRTYIKEW